jgi:26S proteasome regulatory subunit T5
VIGLVDAEKLKPGDLVGVNKDSYLILETLPAEYDARVKAMEVDERPTEQYSDIGGLDKQIQEVLNSTPACFILLMQSIFSLLKLLFCP